MEGPQLDSTAVRFRAALIATGSEALLPPIDGLNAARPMTSDSVWSLRSLPRRLLVLGGGTTGCELGQAFARLGADVTLVESGRRLLGSEDPDASALIDEALRGDGVTVRTGAALVRVRSDEGDFDGSGWTAELSDGREVGFDQILVAVGRRPRTDGLGLDDAGVRRTERGHVDVDDRLRTSNPRIWAAGDVTGGPQYTHVAGVHGSAAAANAVLGLRRTVSTTAVPRVTYTQPEVASVGLVAEAAGSDALTVRTVRHDRIDRPITENRTVGFSRLTVDRRHRIVGATVVSPRAGESLAELVLAVEKGLTTSDVTKAMHAYPTYSDGVWNAAIEDFRAQLGGALARRGIRLLRAVRRRRNGASRSR